MSELRYNVHLIVKYSHDFNFVLADDFEENYVTTLGELEITDSDKIARFSYRRVFGKAMKSIIKFLDAYVSLRLAPAFFCVFRNRSQIIFR